MLDFIARPVPAFLVAFLTVLTVGYVFLALTGYAPAPELPWGLSWPSGKCYGPGGACFTRP